MENSQMFDVFIAYHGDGKGKGKSSYSKAEELYEFLKKREISCFLCPKESAGKFTVKIDNALRSSRHFILVACDPKMLSAFVYKEVDRFDALDSNGKKPFCYFSAYIYGDLSIDELIDFHSAFATTEIVQGDNNDSFEKIYSNIISEDDALFSKIISDLEKSLEDAKKFIEEVKTTINTELQEFLQFSSSVMELTSTYSDHCYNLTELLVKDDDYIVDLQYKLGIHIANILCDTKYISEKHFGDYISTKLASCSAKLCDRVKLNLNKSLSANAHMKNLLKIASEHKIILEDFEKKQKQEELSLDIIRESHKQIASLFNVEYQAEIFEFISQTEKFIEEPFLQNISDEIEDLVNEWKNR